MTETIPVVQHLLDANEQVARENRALFDRTPSPGRADRGH